MTTGQFPAKREDDTPVQPQAVLSPEDQGMPILIETIINAAMMSGGRVQMQDGTTLQIIQFVCPNGMAYTIKLSEEGKQGLIRILTGGIELPGAGALSVLR